MGPPERTGLQRKTRLASGAACAVAAGPSGTRFPVGGQNCDSTNSRGGRTRMLER